MEAAPPNLPPVPKISPSARLSSGRPQSLNWPLLALLVFLAGLVPIIVGFSLYFEFLGDESAPNDTDLLARAAPVPEEENGLVQLCTLNGTLLDFSAFATRSYKESVDLEAILNGDEHDDVLVDSFLWQARPALASLDNILVLPHFEIPKVQTLNKQLAETPYAVDVRQVLELSALRARQTGDFNLAVTEIKRLRRLATRFSENETDLVNLFTAGSLDERAARAARDLLNDPASTPASRAVLAQAWAVPFSWTTAMQRADCGEYRRMIYTFDHLPETISANAHSGDTLEQIPKPLKDWGQRMILQRNRTRREVAAVLRQIQAALDGPYGKIDPSLTKSPHDALAALPTNFPSNLVGEIFVQMTTDMLRHEIASPYLYSTQDRLVQTALAARNYYDGNHALPQTLAALVPEYLPAVPLDPFDGQPLRYNPARGLIYSVGTDLKDNGGSKSVDLPHEAKEYTDPLADKQQPTLVLRFQNSAPAATP